MQTKIKSNFKAVDFMRQVRNELSALYQADKQRYHQELNNTLADFKKLRSKSVKNTTEDTVSSVSH